MDYFDLKAEIDSIIDEAKEVMKTPNVKNLNLGADEKEVMDEIKSQCHKFLNLLVSRSKLAMSH